MSYFELTAEQLALAQRIRDEYAPLTFPNGRATNRAMAEQALTELYALAKLPAPPFVWFPSPFAAMQTLVESTGSYPGFSAVDGHYDGMFLALIEFAQAIGFVMDKEAEPFIPIWRRLAEACGPCWPYEGICLCTDLPSVYKVDDQRRLHCTDGQAVRWEGGTVVDPTGKNPDERHEPFGLFYINGIRLPARAIREPWTMTLEHIENPALNEDQRTLLQQLWCYEDVLENGDRRGVGGGRYLAETGAKVIDIDTFVGFVDDNGEEVQYSRVLLRDKRNRQFLMCTDSGTQRIYYIRVLPNAKNCREAHEGINGGIKDAKIRVSA